jgi:hypothetical protein
VLVSDNLNTHKSAALYEAFAPEEARHIMDWLFRPSVLASAGAAFCSILHESHSLKRTYMQP